MINYLIEIVEQARAGDRHWGAGRYLKRSAQGALTDDPEAAVILPEEGCRTVASHTGLRHSDYTLVESRPILAAHRRALREKRVVAQRALATEIRRRFHGLGVFVGGKTKREVSVSLAGLQIAEFYVDLDAKIHRVGSGDEGGIENACWHLSKRIAEIRLAADLAQA